MDIRRIGAIKEKDEIVGNRTRVKVVKNKVAPPFRDVEFDIMYGQGISREGDILDLAVANKIVEKSGAWYSYNNEKIGQGRENAKSFLKLKENAALLDEIQRKILAIHGHEQSLDGSDEGMDSKASKKTTRKLQ